MRDEVGQRRGVPDVSMSAACDGAVDVYMTVPGLLAGWYPTCGTSEATPLFAGIVALAAQWGHHSLGLINPALYRMREYNEPGIVNVNSGSNNVSFYQGGKLRAVGGFSAERVQHGRRRRHGERRAVRTGTSEVRRIPSPPGLTTVRARLSLAGPRGRPGRAVSPSSERARPG